MDKKRSLYIHVHVQSHLNSMFTRTGIHPFTVDGFKIQRHFQSMTGRDQEALTRAGDVSLKRRRLEDVLPLSEISPRDKRCIERVTTVEQARAHSIVVAYATDRNQSKQARDEKKKSRTFVDQPIDYALNRPNAIRMQSEKRNRELMGVEDDISKIQSKMANKEAAEAKADAIKDAKARMVVLNRLEKRFETRKAAITKLREKLLRRKRGLKTGGRFNLAAQTKKLCALVIGKLFFMWKINSMAPTR